MRDIEFRGLGRYSRAWRYGWIVGNCIITQDDFGVEYEVDPETVGQFTGLRDKNGVKIFDGDIIKHVRSITFGDGYDGEPIDDDKTITRIGVISITTSKGVCINGHKKVVNDITGEINVYETGKYRNNPGCYSEYSEVIGNIHQNPELLDRGIK